MTESEYVTFNVNKGWLNRVKAQIDFLTISNSDIKYIEDEAFKSPALTYTQHLNLEGLLIDIFHVETFQNLPALTRLKIANLTELKIIRPLTLESVSATLVRLEIRNILASFWNSQGLNFIGSVPMPVLRELFLVNNDLSNKITNSAFKNLTALTSLQLTTSGITSLPVDVFENLSPTVNSIRLDGNLLQSVPEGIFDGPIARNSNVKINLSGNRWHW